MTDWKRKLAAFLHDPPSKPFNIVEHRAIAKDLIVAAGLDLAEAELFFAKVCDHTAAASDRVVCPKASVMNADWSLLRAFKHPLGGGNLSFTADMTAGLAEKKVADAQPHGYDWAGVSSVADRQDWARFFIHWRLWPQLCAQSDPRLLHLPADTRIPDHSVWTHCSLVSALTSCVEVSGQGEGMVVKEFKPAFLLVQIGPVQEFIAQARSTRDLWSGSYLLSWLIAHGIKAVTDEIGPDCVLFPALRGQPLFDFLHKTDLYEKLGLWDDLRHSHESILTPNLPNRFLAVVPAGQQGEKLAQMAEDAMRGELCNSISAECLKWFKDQGLEMEPTALTRWHQQLRQFLTVHWQVWPWAGNVRTAINNFKKLPAGNTPADGQQVAPAESLERAFAAATQGIPFKDLDPRNYKHRSRKEADGWHSECVDADGRTLAPDKPPITDNPGFAWAAHYGALEFWLAARRNTRDFERWGQLPGASSAEQKVADVSREGSTKDVLSGKEESIGSPDWQKNLVNIEGNCFREGERLGAINLVKRVWPLAYLDKVQQLPRHRIAFDSVPAVAAAKWRSDLLARMLEDETTWHAFLDFARKAVAARSLRYFDVPKEAPDENSRMDESRWLAWIDAAALHQNEWRRAIAEESERKNQREGAVDKLKHTLGALAELQKPKREGGLGKPLAYVAILAMDGDSMGQWVSGAKSPIFKEQLAAEAVAYFNDPNKPESLRKLLEAPRHVSPSYHLQFSEALANFSLYLARPIVEFFDGQLIYSGGDDILAMLPAERALGCARALRMAFKSDPDLWRCFDDSPDFHLESSESPVLPGKPQQWGFVGLNGQTPALKRVRSLIPLGYPLLVPGKNADISAGIAIGHMHTPLQNLIEAARRAEKQAKNDYRDKDSGALAAQLYKRSGEVIHWGAKWQDAAIELADQFGRLTEDGKLTAKFPYALAAALRPYAEEISVNLAPRPDEFRIATVNGFDPFKVFEAEFRHALRQHSDGKWHKTDGRGDFAELAQKYLGQCNNRRLNDFLGPFLTSTFIRKGAD
ncbi:MAG: type III-B CRISPR-associated protein Cas10/Cmr2 [Verrucomicrobia bacterium]|nr:type III-B CRISPR-associated protein Cas10/Cmr2 [Verrucomicrobiota bacterium]